MKPRSTIYVRTQILSAGRNRPQALKDEGRLGEGRLASRIENGQPPSEIADAVFEGIRGGQFYIWPGDEVDHIVRTRFEHILARSNPEVRPFG